MLPLMRDRTHTEVTLNKQNIYDELCFRSFLQLLLTHLYDGRTCHRLYTCSSRSVKQKKHHRFMFYFLFTVNLMEIAYKSVRSEAYILVLHIYSMTRRHTATFIYIFTEMSLRISYIYIASAVNIFFLYIFICRLFI